MINWTPFAKRTVSFENFIGLFIKNPTEEELLMIIIIHNYTNFMLTVTCVRSSNSGQYISIPRVSPFSLLRYGFRYQANLNPFFNLYFTVKWYQMHILQQVSSFPILILCILIIILYFFLFILNCSRCSFSQMVKWAKDG